MKERVELTSEELSQLTQFAEHFFSIYQCALLLEKDPFEFKKLAHDETTDVGKAYLRGHLLSQMKIRKAVMKMAEAGSNPAQVLMKQFLQECLSENLLKR